MVRQSDCSSSSGARSKLETEGERLRLKFDGNGVRSPVFVDSSCDATPGAFRFRGFSSRVEVTATKLRDVIEPGGGKSSI
jgi:hypothetical protein